METNLNGNLPPINSDVLTDVVRAKLASETAEIKTWHLLQIGGGMGNPVSVGLFRVQGIASEKGTDQSWSVILKVLQSPANVGEKDMGESEDPTHWNYWKREPLVYRSGLLENLPDGLTAPCCYGIEQLPGNIAHLWLEDIQDLHHGVWSLERYKLTARHIGRLNGKFISASNFAEYPWLGRELNRQWLHSFPWKTLQWDHPITLNRYPEPDLNPFKQLLFEHERFFEKLDLLPKTISHGDTYPTNFMSRIGINGKEQTVALDWALIGLQPLGDDLGSFVFGAVTDFKNAAQSEVIDELFGAYLQGLRDEGCELDARTVRYGFVVSAALRVGLFQLFFINDAIEKSSPNLKIDESNRPPDAFEVVMAREAFRLIEE